MADNRKKGCPNEACEAHKKEIKWKAEESFCSKCGTKLVFVCAKCFKEIEDIDEKHKLCARCEQERNDNMQKIKEGAKNAGKAVAAVGGAIAVKAGKDIGKAAVNKGTKIVEKAAKAVFKI